MHCSRCSEEIAVQAKEAVFPRTQQIARHAVHGATAETHAEEGSGTRVRVLPNYLSEPSPTMESLEVRRGRTPALEKKMDYLRMDLKVCEGCGALWLRAGATKIVYCLACTRKLAEFPAPKSRRQAGRTGTRVGLQRCGEPRAERRLGGAR